jgi:hypothetical protein
MRLLALRLLALLRPAAPAGFRPAPDTAPQAR